MDMNLQMHTFWWLIAGLAVAVELVTGTFYLLMLALGMVAAALGAHAGFDFSVQLLIAALVGGGAVVIWHQKSGSKRRLPNQENKDLHLDIGQAVDVSIWSASGTAQVEHRGASWSAKPVDTAGMASGMHKIVAIEGNTLVLMKS